MCSPFRRTAALVVVALWFVAVGHTRELKVCADPDNMPFSHRNQQGFENRIAEVLAKDLHADLKYTWARQGRGFVRNVLNANKCDLLLSVPVGYRGVLETNPYYRSTYVFVQRRGAGERVQSFDDPQLRRMSIGVQVVGEDYAPPGRALARRGNITNIRGFESTGAEAADIIREVAQRKIDIAVVWGPLAGFYARRYGRALLLQPVQPQMDIPALPLTFAIAMGVRKNDSSLRDEVDAVLKKHSGEIRRILRSYGVPLLDDIETKEGE